MRWTRLSHGLLLASCRHWHRRWFELLRSRLMLWLKSLSTTGHRHLGHLIRHLALHLLIHWRVLALRRSLCIHILVVGGIERCLLLIDLLPLWIASLVVVSTTTATHVVTAIVLLPPHLVVLILAAVTIPRLLLLVLLHHGVVLPAVSTSSTHWRHTCRRWHIVLHVGVVRLEGVVHVVVHRRRLLSRRGFELCDVARHLERRLEVSHSWVQGSSVCRRCRLRCLVATENTQKQYNISTRRKELKEWMTS